ncbi:DNA topology modulation protein FlaR [Chelativorans sp. AA-79]|uniref:DNA topology modulation protein FlaR n=1 Tax=Chelativorans sp. AA-79 TaxID=3028735 RepID=UPI0023F9B3DB|nr:DNA topology modulation protein FlaR [Chelativorans sp. AA-79]WEX07067.1 DNA topology modulation protein FlaR [Chelativorans sp. AA-79]
MGTTHAGPQTTSTAGTVGAAMKRVLVIGGPGSGKSTLARRIGDALRLPVFHFDHIHWKSGWVPRPEDEKLPLIEEIIAGDAWVLEGNHSRSYAMRVARTDTLVFLDMPRRLRMTRLLRRWLRYRGTTRPDLPHGCNERLELEFLRYSWEWDRTTRPRALRLAEDSAGALDVHVLRSPAEVRRFETYLCERGTD